MLLKVNPAGHFITAQFHGSNFDFRALTAVGSGIAAAGTVREQPITAVKNTNC